MAVTWEQQEPRPQRLITAQVLIAGAIKGCLPARGVRKAVVQLFDKVFDGKMPAQLAASLVLMLLDAQPRAEPVEHLDDLGRPLLGQQIDLQIEMIPAIGDHPMRFCFISTKAASKTASSEVIDDGNG